MTIETVTEIGRQAIETHARVGIRTEPRGRLDRQYVSGDDPDQRSDLTFVPKVLAVFAATLLFLPWMLGVLIAF